VGSTDNCVLSVAEADAARLKTSFKPTKDFKPLYTGGPITGIDSPAAGAFLVACACGESVNLVDWASSSVVRQISADTEEVTSIAAAPDGKSIVTVGRLGIMRRFDVTSGAEVRLWKSGEGVVLTLAYDGTSTLVAAGTAVGLVKVFDTDRGYCTHVFRRHVPTVTAVAFHPKPNQLQLFSAGEEGTHPSNICTGAVLTPAPIFAVAGLVYAVLVPGLVSPLPNLHGTGLITVIDRVD
jgi:U3 small nucleolar RNA-associated protein 13